MNSYRALAIKELFAQRVTSVLILIAVMLSTMMTTVVGQSLGVLTAMREQQAIALGGNRYATFLQMDADQLHAMQQDERLSYVGASIYLGSMELTSSLNLGLTEYQGDNASIYPSSTNIKEGKLPQAPMELALPEDVLQYLGFDGKVRTKAELRLHFDNRRWIAFMTKMAPTELVRTDDLAIGRAAHVGQAGFVRAADALRSMLRSNERAEADRAYIQRCFGRSMYAPKQLSAIEQQRCTGNHLGCRLWFTRGDPAADVLPSSDSQQLYEQAAEQARLNRAAYAENSELYESALLRLTEQIRNCMLVHQQPEAVTARQGWVDGARVWREPVLGDDRVFLRQDQEPKPGFSVDLLLDGSASRLHCQETIAAQGYILAKSLLNCGIPVRVTSFCSLRGYTVLRVLKEYGDKQGERRIFDYFAAGWNRDGLALRGMEELMQSAPAEKHLLLILTDANPDDSHRIPPNGKNPISREYDGKAGVEDTADEVRDLRRRGIRVAAIFMGEQDSVPAADRIYGKDLARIRRMDQLAQAAGRLIQDQIRELAN